MREDSASTAADLHESTRLLLALIVVAGFLLRWQAAETAGLWLDEAVSLQIVQQPVSLATLRANDDPTPPFYYWLLRGWLQLFGDSLESARGLSVLLSTVSTALVFDLGRRHLSVEAGLVAAALFASSRLQIYYGHEVRCYALVGALCVASFHLFFALATRPAWTKVLGLAALNAALLSTHYLTAFVLVTQVGAAAVLMRRNIRSAVLYGWSLGFSALLFSPLLYQAAHSALTEKDWIGPPTLGRVRFVVKRFAGSSTLLTAYGAIAAVVAWLRRNSEPATMRPFLAALALWAFLPVGLAYATSFFRQVLLDRYLLYSSPALYLLVASVIAIAPTPMRVRALVSVAVVTASLATSLADPIQRHDWRSAAAVIREEQERGAAVVVAPYWQFRPLAYYVDPAGLADHQHTRSRLEEAGITLVEDVRTLRLQPRRHVLVIAPEAVPPATVLDGWLAESGFVTVRRDHLQGLLLLIVEPLVEGEATSRSRSSR